MSDRKPVQATLDAQDHAEFRSADRRRPDEPAEVHLQRDPIVLADFCRGEVG